MKKFRRVNAFAALFGFASMAYVAACASPDSAPGGERVGEAEQADGYIGQACWSNGTCTTGSSCYNGPGASCYCRDLSHDTVNCGYCGNTCSGSTPVCHGGSCSSTCDSGWSICYNGPGGKPECRDTYDDPNNCGYCGNVCPGAYGAHGICVSGTCELACNSGFDNCDGNWSNGCESLGSASNCGYCGHACHCVYPGSPFCDNGTCACSF